MAIFGHILPVIIGGIDLSGATPGSISANGLIDTGASDICIDFRLAQQLGLKAIDQTMVVGVGGTLPATVYMGRLVVPDVEFDQLVRLYALKVRHPTHEVLLGRAFLQNYIVTFNGPSGLFHFSTPQDHRLHGTIEDDFAT